MLVNRLAVAGCLWFSAAPSCGLFSSRQPKSDGAPARSEILVEVESHNWSDIVIYLMTGGQSQRLGMVPAVSTKQFVFPYGKLTSGGRVRLRAYPVGGPGSFMSEDILIQPGQWIKWTLENDLSRSSMSVY